MIFTISVISGDFHDFYNLRDFKSVISVISMIFTISVILKAVISIVISDFCGFMR